MNLNPYALRAAYFAHAKGGKAEDIVTAYLKASGERSLLMEARTVLTLYAERYGGRAEVLLEKFEERGLTAP